MTSLPSNVLAGATWRLVSSGTLAPRGSGYAADPERAAAALREEAVTRLVHGQASFALLPRTGDLFAVDEQDGGWLRDLEQKIAPHRQAPLPPALWSASLSAYQGDQVRARRVAGLDRDVVDVAARDDDPTLGELVPADPAHRCDEPAVRVCPVYLCHAELRQTDAGIQVVRASAFGRPRRGGSAPGPAQPEEAEIEIDLTAAREQAARWAVLAGALDDPETLHDAWLELSAVASASDPVPPLTGAGRRGLGTWDLLADGAAATLLCAQPRPLSEPRGLAVESDDEVVHLTCHFFPADDTARALFARDDLIMRLLAARQSAVRERPPGPSRCRVPVPDVTPAPGVIWTDGKEERLILAHLNDIIGRARRRLVLATFSLNGLVSRRELLIEPLTAALRDGEVAASLLCRHSAQTRSRGVVFRAPRLQSWAARRSRSQGQRDITSEIIRDCTAFSPP